MSISENSFGLSSQQNQIVKYVRGFSKLVEGIMVEHTSEEAENMCAEKHQKLC